MIVFSICFKSFTNCCGKRWGTTLWFLIRLARLYFLGKDENLSFDVSLIKRPSCLDQIGNGLF